MHGQELSENPGTRWYVVQSKPREEWRAVENLARQGYESYLPTIVHERVQQGCKVERQEPLFPRYFFIRLDEVTSNWYPIRHTRGVSQLVRFDEHPLPVADEIIDLIRDRLCRKETRVPYLRPGERVRITEAAFAQLEAIFVASDGTERVVLLMNILQQEQRLTFPVTSVRKVG